MNPVPGTSSAPAQAVSPRPVAASAPPAPPASAPPVKKHKHRIQPAAVAQQLRSYDLFGTDSEDDDAVHHSRKAGMLQPLLTSYFVTKLSKGYSHQTVLKSGSCYVVLKVYECSEMLFTQSDRWKYLTTVIKNMTNDGTNTWNDLKRFIYLTRKEFKNSLRFTTISPFMLNNLLFKGRPREDMKTSALQKRAKSPHSSLPVPPPPPPPPPSPARNTTARDLFGSDSDDAEFDEQAANPGKKLAPLNSYLTRKLDKGVVRKMWDSKPGSHYIELKVYKCDDISRVQPMNRWRHAAISIKNRTFDDTLAWQALTKFIAETRKEFKHCPPTFIGI